MKVFLFFILLLMGACTTKNDSSVNDKAQQTLTQLKALMKEGKLQEAIKISKQKITETLQVAENTKDKDSLIHYFQQLFDICHHSYLHSRQDREGIKYIDSLSQNPILQQYCRYELLSSRAGLHQMIGDNREAIQLADEYLKLPQCTDADRFIEQAEIISGVYIYCGNNIPKAIEIIERALEAYENGGRYSNMIRLISRLGIYYRLVGKYEKAAATNQKAISSYNDSVPPQNVVIAYGEQANLYNELGMYDHALEMNKKAQYYSLLRDSFGLGDLYRYRAEIFRNTGNYDSVFYYLQLGEKTSALNHSYKGVFINKVAMADIYLDCPDSTQKALPLLQSICADSTHVPQWAKHQLNMQLGRALLNAKQEQKGISLIESAAKGYADMGMAGMEYETNKILMDYFQKKGMNDAFMRYYTRNQMFADSLERNKKIRAVAAANIRFETQQKEKENKLLSAQVKLQRQQLLYNVCISITLLMLLVTSIAYLVSRKRANRLLIENNKQEIQKLIARQHDLNRHNEQLNEQIEQAMATNNLNSIRQLTGQNLLSKEDENMFRQSFASIYPSYLPKLREDYPQLTRNEELLAMLICMNQSTDEIALIMGINRNSVNVVRSRMRKNMELPKEKSLDDVLKRYLS